MDARNTPLQLGIVGLFSLGLAVIFKYLLGIQWSTGFARVSFFLLFLILLIGPVMRFVKPKKNSTPLASPWNWRSELGIWFTIMALLHFVFVLLRMPFSSLIKLQGSGFALTNLIGLIALFWAVVLAGTSWSKVIGYFGVESWKWLHSLTYVIFYLVSAHFIYFQFFSTHGSGPDWFGYTAVIMAVLIVVLQLSAFFLSVAKRNMG